MKLDRILFHPILPNRQSRRLFWIFLSISILIGTLLFGLVDHIFSQAGLSTENAPWTFQIFFNFSFRMAWILIAAIFISSLIGSRVVGPTQRLQEWIAASKKKSESFPIQVRKGDEMSEIAELLNKLN